MIEGMIELIGRHHQVSFRISFNRVKKKPPINFIEEACLAIQVCNILDLLIHGLRGNNSLQSRKLVLDKLRSEILADLRQIEERITGFTGHIPNILQGIIRVIMKRPG